MELDNMTRPTVNIEEEAKIGKLVKSRRIEMGMTQAELSKPLGVTFQQFQKYERGANRISASCLYKIACILGVELSYFHTNTKKLDSEVEGDVLRIAKSSKGLSSESRKIVLKVIKTLR